MPDKDYKSTLQLPRADLPMKANLPTREPATLKRWDEIKLYERLIESRASAEPWILHDGPPYANGRVHLGTALNKILKDFVVRSRAMLGYRTPFVPGWDCHGMPIEHKVSRELGPKVRDISKLELRKLCRAEAEKWIDLQREDFRRLGCLGDWQHPYLTMAPEYDAAEIGVLRKLAAAGYIYRGRRPVLWCFDCRTGLAEAEVEYHDHTSPSIYVAFVLNSNLRDAAALAAETRDRAELASAHTAGKLFAVIWTTTPWTLPANLGITLNETFDYTALKAGDRYYIVADRLADAVAKDCGLSVDKKIALSREALRKLDGQDIFRHPFLPKDVRLMFGEHVTADAGTGLVHTAPGHGYEDFVIGAKYGLEPYTPVDDSGNFTKDVPQWAGQNVFKSNSAVVEHLRAHEALVHAQTLAHQYPHCWRCKNPLIFRATEQWFLRIDHEGLRQRVISEIDHSEWIPAWSRDRIRNMTETRPDWNLSRQRAWGVPIPALKCESCEHVGLYDMVMARCEQLFSTEGSDAWYVRPVADFVPVGLKCEKCGETSFTRQEDILDVWFDSGSSQAAVLAKRPELRWPADAYLEAVEQARGWFGSSLTLSCAISDGGRAPFRSVISHGLTVDEKGRKMSKSLGNSEDAADVANRLGADIIRLVYASLDYTSEIALGPTIFSAVSESYRKIRNTFRYLLGNLADFDPARDSVPYRQLEEFDRFILSRLQRLDATVRKAFESFDFQAAYTALLNFVVVDVSSLYIDVARDRLYCDPANSRERRSAQTALFHLLESLLRMFATFIPFTAEEIYGYVPGARRESVHLLELLELPAEWNDAPLEERWSALLAIRGEVLQVLEQWRQEKKIGSPLDAKISLGGGAKLASELERNALKLKELLGVSAVNVTTDGAAIREFSNDRVSLNDVPLVGLRIAGQSAKELGETKCQRCWCYFDDGGDPELCPRCRAVVRALA